MRAAPRLTVASHLPSLTRSSRANLRPVSVAKSADESHGMQTVVAADIGGTNARFQAWVIFDGEKRGEELLHEHVYQTCRFETFESCFYQFIKDTGIASIDSSCFAVAGPVKNDCCEMTNLGWRIDGPSVQKVFQIMKVHVVNDFAAVGHGIAALDPSQIISLNGVLPEERGPIAVIGPGTVKEAIMFWNRYTHSYDVFPTEGSHAPFAPRNHTEAQLLAYMWEKNSKVCEVEHVCSGPGLKNVYDFVCHLRGTKPDDIAPAEISARALSASCNICVSTLRIFLQILGAECSSAALRSLATGGVYIAGGIPTKILPLITHDSTLVDAFQTCNPSMCDLLARFPLMVVNEPNVGLFGAKMLAVRQTSDQNSHEKLP